MLFNSRPSDRSVPEGDFDLLDNWRFSQTSFEIVRCEWEIDFGFEEVLLDTPKRYDTLKSVDDDIGNDIEGESESKDFDQMLVSVSILNPRRR